MSAYDTKRERIDCMKTGHPIVWKRVDGRCAEVDRAGINNNQGKRGSGVEKDRRTKLLSLLTGGQISITEQLKRGTPGLGWCLAWLELDKGMGGWRAEEHYPGGGRGGTEVEERQRDQRMWGKTLVPLP